MPLDLHNTLLAFSEWLDGEGLVVSDQGPDADTRTHDDLAREFVETWNRGHRVLLCGQGA